MTNFLRRVLLGLGLVGVFLATVGTGSASAAATNPASCGSYNLLQQVSLYNAAHLQIGGVLIYGDGCHHVFGYTRTVVTEDLEVDIYSSNITYNVTRCSATRNCYSPKINIGTAAVAAYGWTYAIDNGALVAYATTNFYRT